MRTHTLIRAAVFIGRVPLVDVENDLYVYIHKGPQRETKSGLWSFIEGLFY